MARVAAWSAYPGLKVNIPPEVMSSQIIGAVTVRRPLDNPIMNKRYGKALSHTGVAVRTFFGFVLIEYTYDSCVHVNMIPRFESGKRVFHIQYYEFVCDSEQLQVPDRVVNVRCFAVTMYELMSGRKYSLFHHNCHVARYETMKYFGMMSDDPRSEHKSLIVQGMIDMSKGKELA